MISISKRTLMRLAGAVAVAPVLPAIPPAVLEKEGLELEVPSHVVVSDSAGSSVVLPPPLPGRTFTILNSGSHPLRVFGAVSDNIELPAGSCWEGVCWDGKGYLGKIVG
jgi:hypothetical protein